MIEIGRVCVKIAGRDAGRRCVIIDILEDNFVLIDGETRRRKCNPLHLEPLKETIEIGKDASHEAVAKALGIEARSTKRKSAGERPKQKRKGPEAEEAKTAKKAEKKSAPKKAAPVKKAEEKVAEKKPSKPAQKAD